MNSRKTCTAGLVVLLAGCSSDDGSQPQRATPADSISASTKVDVLECSVEQCGVQLEPVATISDAQVLGELRGDVVRRVARDGQGRLLTAGLHSFLIYGQDGSFVGKAGRPGSGPGEFSWAATPLIGPGDSVHVFDHQGRRLSVFAPDMSFARSSVFPYGPAIALSDGTYVVAQQLTTRERAGYPIHTADAYGGVIRSFGTDTAQHRRDLEPVTTRVVGLAPDGMIWAAAPGRYVIEKWDPASGSKLQRIAVTSDWFEESNHYERDGERPRSLIDGLWEDDAGLVWVLFRTADKNWSAGRPEDFERERPVDPMKHLQTYDSVIEVVDPRSGEVVASQRFDEVFTVHPQGDILASQNLSDPQFVRWDLWTAAMVTDREVP